MFIRLLVLHGAKLKPLGSHATEVYGRATLAQIEAEPAQIAADACAAI